MKIAAIPKRLGFTIIEVLVVLTILGILAALSISRLSDSRERAFIGVMQSDLRQLLLAQELFYEQHDGTYATDVEKLIEQDLYRPTTGVTVEIYESDDDSGWSARASHVSTGVTCAVGTPARVIGCSNNPEESERELEVPGTNVIAF